MPGVAGLLVASEGLAGGLNSALPPLPVGLRASCRRVSGIRVAPRGSGVRRTSAIHFAAMTASPSWSRSWRLRPIFRSMWARWTVRRQLASSAIDDAKPRRLRCWRAWPML
jgi:hypothetical protein